MTDQRFRVRDGAQNRGYVMVTVVMASTVLFGFMGLALDLGYFEYLKRRAQLATDAAAVAGALEVGRNSATTTVVSSAKSDSSLNGFTDGANGVTVTINHPPTSGTYAGDNNAVEAIVAQSRSTFFMQVLKVDSATVTTRAVAHTGGGPNCVYVLDSAAQGALTTSGSSAIQVSCGIIVDSNNSKAFVPSGSACVTATAIDVVGNWSNQTSCAPSPTPTTGVDVESDPLSYLTAPTVGACDYGTATTTKKINSGTTNPLSPGVYCNGITVSGNGVSAQLSAGTYILLGGGLTVSGGANITGTGVTFYNTYSTTYSYKPIVISGGSSTQLSAPTSGSLQGILFFQDRNLLSTDLNKQNTVSGTSSTQFQGALYFKTTPLVYSGGSAASTAYTVIVADTLTVSGASTINSNYSSLHGESPIRVSAVLGE